MNIWCFIEKLGNNHDLRTQSMNLWHISIFRADATFRISNQKLPKLPILCSPVLSFPHTYSQSRLWVEYIFSHPPIRYFTRFVPSGVPGVWWSRSSTTHREKAGKTPWTGPGHTYTHTHLDTPFTLTLRPWSNLKSLNIQVLDEQTNPGRTYKLQYFPWIYCMRSTLWSIHVTVGAT